VLFRLLLLIGFSLAPLAAQTPVTPLASTRAVRELDRRTAAQGLPVTVKGVVTFASPRKDGSFIVDDGGTGVYVAANDAAARGLGKPELDFTGPIEVGMLIEVTGVTAPGGFAPVVMPRRLRFLGTGPLPPVKRVGVVDLQTGRFDCERVRVRGVVQHAEISGRLIDAVRLELAGLGGHFVAYALKPAGFDAAKLVDAEVDLSGVALSFFNERAELVGARVQIQGIEDLEIVRAAPESPFLAPEARLDGLMPFSPEAPKLHRRRVSGIVTVAKPGAYFYLQDGARAVRVATRDPSVLVPGDRVEVSGFVELWNYFAEIREAVFRKIGTAPVPEAEPVTRAVVLTSRPWIDPPEGASHLDGRRVILRGRLEKVESSEEAGRRLTLDCDGYAIFATLVNDAPQDALNRLVPGSEVSATGVCQIQLSAGRPTVSNPVPTGFQLLVHASEDIVVLSVPSWWTPQRLWMALGGTAVVLALALIWAWLLRRRVAQRSAELAAEIGARRNAAVEFDATLRERKRLAADLHDTLEQALMGLALQLEAVDLFHQNEPDRSTHHLHLARQFLARSREDVRRSVWNLRAQGLEGRTLLEALQSMVSRLTAGQAVQTCCEHEGEPVPLPDFIAGNLLLLAQEAMTNALKHADPKTILVKVGFGKEEIAISIVDDGEGFDVATAPGLQEGHFGLQGMRERVKRLGGRLEIESTPGGGTRITAHVPTQVFDAMMAN
jgi:signal transduction histidine kinase